METFIYKDLKKASLEKDISKVLTLGPYAYAISEIIHKGMYKKKKNNKLFLDKYLKPIYRGILINEEEYNQLFVENIFNTAKF